MEALHQLRVNLRRLINYLWIFKSFFPSKVIRSWTKSLRKLAIATGSTRDLDIQILFLRQFRKNVIYGSHKISFNALLEVLEKKRQKNQSKLVKLINKIEKKGTLTDIKAYLNKMAPTGNHGYKEKGEDLYQIARKRIIKRLNQFLTFEKYARQYENAKKLHEMRIAAKHLRYSLEGLGMLYKQKVTEYRDHIYRVHRTLGEVHDYDVWIDRLLSMKKKANKNSDYDKALVYLCDQIRMLRRQAYEKFLEYWQDSQSKKIWQRLAAISKN